MTFRTRSSTEIAVVGGGVIGLGIAWEIARLGGRVSVVDPAPGRAASWAAAGLLAPVTEAHYGETALLRLNLDSQRRYPDFVRALEDDAGVEVGYRACGTLVVARDADDNAALSELFSFQQRLGLRARRLRSTEVRGLEAGIAPTIRGGIDVPDDHQIDNRALVEALILACRARGVDFIEGTAIEIRTDRASVTGLDLEDGHRLQAEQVVIAAGARTSQIGGIPSLPVRPVKGQLLHLRAREGQPLLGRNVRGLDVYLVPRPDGRLVVGATMEEQGFDGSVTAGAIRDLLTYAFELVPGITELELTEIAVGHRPCTPDNAPLLGRLGVEGLHIATGHFRNGLLLLPVTAHALGVLVSEGRVVDEILEFSADRFRSVEVAS